MFGDVVTIPQSLAISVGSMAVVFLVLLVISYMIDLNAWVLKKMTGGDSKGATKAASSPAASGSSSSGAAAAASAAASAASEAAKAHEQAVLAAAAIAAYLGTSVDHIVVRRITRVADNDTGWAKQALQDNMR